MLRCHFYQSSLREKKRNFRLEGIQIYKETRRFLRRHVAAKASTSTSYPRLKRDIELKSRKFRDNSVFYLNHDISTEKYKVFADFPASFKKQHFSLADFVFVHNNKRSYSVSAEKALEEDHEETYQILSPIEHILHRPGMYIGRTQSLLEEQVYKYNPTKSKFEFHQEYSINSPALLKIFDEIIVNASDHRMKYPQECTRIDVTIDRESSAISIKNNGKGIPIYIHDKEQKYLPQLLFGRLLTGSNFNDEHQRVTAGTHGYGAKLTNIFSKSFQVETTDSSRQLKYVQEWNNNMTQVSNPEISPYHGDENYTQITFTPDLIKLTTFPILKKKDFNELYQRVLDLAGCIPRQTQFPLQIYFNNTLIPITGFRNYIPYYLSKKNEHYSFTTLKESQWEIGITKSTNSKHQAISFVNGVRTNRGGSHVDVITKQILTFLKQHLEKLNPEWTEILKKQNLLKKHFLLFVNAVYVDNPTFDSQMKDCLTSKLIINDDKYLLPNTFLKELVSIGKNGSTKLGILEEMIHNIELQEKIPLLKLSRLNSGSTSKTNKLFIPKLDDANMAGISKPGKKICTLILTEGDSAKALALNGLEVLGRDYYGVFPLRGKFINVRSVSTTSLLQNAEVQHLCQILNLNFDKTYETQKQRDSLRYGHIMLMTDQDNDGSHIKGLIMNFFRYFWPKLLIPTVDGQQNQEPFLSCFKTPLLKASLAKKETLSFYSQKEFDLWKHSITAHQFAKYKIKYYKGLGTSTPKEAKEYFKNLSKNNTKYKWNSEDEDGVLLDMVFDKHKSAERKEWILASDKNHDSIAGNEYERLMVDYDGEKLQYKDFINTELIEYSKANLRRSIPCLIDGLKPSQRKVLYACFLKKLYKEEMKVAQLSGFCSERTAYHHGEASLHSTIIKLCQDFVGAQNVNLLQPIGQFGTRHAGGNDAASPRYIYTKLSPVARLLFPEVDDVLLNRREDDGELIEPFYYCPIVPLILVNGSQGIGTGWSTNIPSFNILDIIVYIQQKLKQKLQETPEAFAGTLEPYTNGFKGSISKHTEEKENVTKYISCGNFEQISPTKIVITELPVNVWTDDYKQFLMKLKKKGEIVDFDENHTSGNISFTVKLSISNPLVLRYTNLKKQRDITKQEDMIKRLKDDIHKKFRLISPIFLTNMFAFDENEELRSFDCPEDMIDHFFPVRYNLYERRKQHMQQSYLKQLTLLQNKEKFVEMICNDEIDVRRMSKERINEILREKEFAGVTNNSIPLATTGKVQNNEFDYLLNIPLSSFSSENILKLQRDSEKAKEEHDRLNEVTVERMWEEDLHALEDFILKNKELSSHSIR